jgi:hypothetical protein
LYLSGLFRNFRGVRNIAVSKIGASGDYLKFTARANTNSEVRTHPDDFIPDNLICARQLNVGGNTIWITQYPREIMCENNNQEYLIINRLKQIKVIRAEILLIRYVISRSVSNLIFVARVTIIQTMDELLSFESNQLCLDIG